MLLITMGFLAALAIYHLLIFFRRKKDYSHLAYGLFCLAIVAGKHFGNNSTPDNIFSNSIFIASGYVCAIVILIFSKYIFRIKRLIYRKILNLLGLFLGVYLVVIILFSIAIDDCKILFPFYFPALALFALLCILSLIYTVVVDKIYQDKVKTSVISGFIAMIIIFIVSSVMYSLNLPVSSIIFNIGLLLNCAIYANALSVYISREHTALRELNEKLEEKVEERTHQLNEASHEKTAFFINLAHECKTPLTLIKIYLDKYIKEYGVNEKIQVIKNNIDKLTNDMVNFLDAEKIKQGRMDYEDKEPINFSDCLCQRLLLFKNMAEKENIFIIEEIDPEVTIYFNPAALDRVINNLIENAIRYNKQNGQVWISLKKLPEEKVLFSVKDNGPGIPEEQQPSIFDRYYQLSKEKSNSHGMGMGLFITKSIIDLCRGELRFSSTQGEGTLFEVILDSHSVKANIKEKDATSTETVNFIPVPQAVKFTKINPGKRTLLFVEDHRELLYYLREEFSDSYNVILAENGREAFRYLKENEGVDLIVSDIMMDEMDGYKLRECIMEMDNCRTIPFIFLTAKTGKDDELQGLSQGAVDYISKPFEISTLKEKIKSWLMLIELKRNREDIELKLKHQRRLESFIVDFCINKREREVIEFLLLGCDNNTIAGKMFISVNTVKKHIERIKLKLHIDKKQELIIFLFNYIYK